MFSIKSSPLPEGAFLQNEITDPEVYADCFYADLPRRVTLQQYIRAYFDAPVFRAERVILKHALSSPSTTEDVHNLAKGTGTSLAAWHMTHRDNEQILLAIPKGPVRTWLMVTKHPSKTGHSRLYFGTALVPPSNPRKSQLKIPPVYRFFIGPHRLYSRLLLSQAIRALRTAPEDRLSLSI